MARHAALGQKVYFVDMYTALSLADLADGIHPNQTGYSKMAARWYGCITQVLSGVTPFPGQPRMSIKLKCQVESCELRFRPAGNPGHKSLRRLVLHHHQDLCLWRKLDVAKKVQYARGFRRSGRPERNFFYISHADRITRRA